MKYKKLTFLKVPFDNSYSNLYTFPTLDSLAPADIANALIDYGFQSYVITAEKNRYFRITNGNVIMSVPVDYDFIKDFNYVIAQTENPDEYTKFYFVTGYSSLNLGENNSTNIDIEYDVYLNNYHQISTCPEIFTQVSGHIDDVIKTSDNNYYPKHLRPAELASNMVEQYTDTGYQVLFLILTLDGEGEYYKEESGVLTSVNLRSVYGAASQLPVIMCPIAVLDTATHSFEPDGKWTLSENAVQPTVGSMLITNQIFKIGAGEHIVQAQLTYNPPFNYTVKPSENKIVIDELLGKTSYQIDTIYLKRTNGTDIVYDPIVSTSCSVDGEIIDSAKIITGPFASSVDEVKGEQLISRLFFTDIPSSYSTSQDAKPYLIPELYSYPYNYYKVYCSGSIIDIIPPENSVGFDIIRMWEGMFNGFYISFFDKDINEIYHTQIYPIENNGFVPVIASSEDLFFRNQGNSYNAQVHLANLNYIKNTITSTISSMTAVPTSKQEAISSIGNRITSKIDNAFDAYKNYVTLKAQLNDAISRQDYITNVSAEALKNCLYLDMIYVRQRVIDYTANIYVQFALNLYKNGVDSPSTTTLLNSNRYLFFYRRCYNVNVSLITNIDERIKITKIFENGATFWKLIDKNSTPEDVASVKYMLKTRNNPVNIDA